MEVQYLVFFFYVGIYQFERLNEVWEDECIFLMIDIEDNNVSLDYKILEGLVNI